MRARWTAVNWLNPSVKKELSDNQLSVLYRFKERDHNLLAFDMGVWGPFSGRRERAIALAAHFQNANGQWVTKDIPGAESLSAWEAEWQFATTGFIMGDYVERGVADAYKDKFIEFAKSYPEAWWVCCKAEWEFRFEYALVELRRQRSFHAQFPGMSQYNPEKPWNSVLLAGITGLPALEYWNAADKDAQKEVNRVRGGSQPPPLAGRQPDPFGGAQHTQAPYGLGKKAAKRAAAQAAAAQFVGKKPKGGGKQAKQPPSTDTPFRRIDGRYTTTVDGVDLCYTWNRNAGGCGQTCQGTPPRAHACEWCRGEHRAINCPSHPGWVPPPKGKSKGKGKNQM